MGTGIKHKKMYRSCFGLHPHFYHADIPLPHGTFQNHTKLASAANMLNPACRASYIFVTLDFDHNVLFSG